MVRYGVIGTAWITDSFIEGASLIEGLMLAAVYSRNLETGKNFADKYGNTNIFTNLPEMAKSDIDAVYIASPNSLHYEQSKLFLEKGKHVICEKPITVTCQELKELQALAKDKNLIYMEAIMMLHLPQVKLLREAISRIGKVTSARLDFSQLSSRYQSYLDGELPNIFNPEFATGCLNDLGIYCIYPALLFFGKPQEVIATAKLMDTGADGSGQAFLNYPDKQFTITYSKLGQSFIGSEIHGDKGTIVIKSISQLKDMKIIFSDGLEEILIGDVEKHILMSGEAQSFYRYITDFTHYSEEYQQGQKLALGVAEIMEDIRLQSHIIYG